LNITEKSIKNVAGHQRKKMFTPLIVYYLILKVLKNLKQMGLR